MHGQAITLFIMNKHTLELTHLLSERLVRLTTINSTLELTKHCVSSHYLPLRSQQELTVKLAWPKKKKKAKLSEGQTSVVYTGFSFQSVSQ